MPTKQPNKPFPRRRNKDKAKDLTTTGAADPDNPPDSLYRQIVEAIPGAVIAIDSNGRMLIVNSMVGQMFGYAPEELVGKPVETLLPERIRQKHGKFRDGYFAAPTPRLMGVGRELAGLRKDGTEFPVEIGLNSVSLEDSIVAVAIITDITGRRQAEEALLESEGRFAVLLHSSPVATAITRASDGEIVDINNNFETLTGLSYDEIIGRTSLDLNLFADPQDRRRLAAETDGKGSRQDREVQVRTKSGDLRDVILASDMVDVVGVKHVVSMVYDITERKQAEDRVAKLNRVYAVLSNINKTIVRVRDPQALLDKACQIAVEDGGFVMAWVGLLNPSTEKVDAAAFAGQGQTYLDRLNIALDDKVWGKGPTATAIRSRNHVISNDIEHDKLMAPWREDALRMGYRSMAAFPLIVSGQVRGTFNLYAGETDFFDEQELNLLDEMAADISFAMEFADQEAQRQQVEMTLRESEEKFRRAIDLAPYPIIIHAEDGELITINKSWTDITGYEPSELPTMEAWVDKAYGDRKGVVMAHVARLFDLTGRFDEGEDVVRTKSGDIRTWQFNSAPLGKLDDGRRLVVSMAVDMTERKRAEAELRLSEELFSNAFHTGPVGMTITRIADGKFIDVNESFCEMLEFKRDEVIEQTSTEVNMLSPEQRKRLIQQQLETGGLHNFELDLKSKSGRLINVLFSSKAMQIKGEPCLLTTLIDITERKRLEQAEHEQRLLAEALRDTAAEVTSTLDLGRVLDRILENVGRVLPHDAKTIMLVEGGVARVASHGGYVERGLGDAVSKESIVVAETPNFAEMRLTGSSLCIPDVRHYSGWVASDSTAWVRSAISAPIKIGDDTLGYINLDSETPGFFSDEQAGRLQAFADQAAVAIRNAKLYQELESYSGYLEKAVTDRTGELFASKNRVETILSSVGDALMVLRMNGRIEQVNPAFERQTGYIAAEAEMQDHHDLLKLEFGSKGDYQGALETLAPGEVWKGQTTVHRKDGSEYDSDFTIAPVRDPNGAMKLLVASIRDITPIKQADRAKDQFVSNVSHELKTPITGLRLNWDLLRRDPEGRERYMGRLAREIERLNTLIEDLLRLSRLDQGREQLDLQPLDLNAMTSQFADDRAPIAESRGLSLITASDANVPTVMADAGLLGQALSVLLTNALNYTPAGGSVTIATSQREVGSKRWAGFSVSDTGPGILESDRHQLFERFYRGSVGRASGAPGTGLGLAIAKEIVRRHSGIIEIDSEGIPGRGTTFSVWLPVYQASAGL